MTLLTYKDKYVVQSSTVTTTASAGWVDDTPAAQTFTLAGSQTVFVLYAPTKPYDATGSDYTGDGYAINVDGTDYSITYDSPYYANRAIGSTCVWVGTLAAGEHTVKGRHSAPGQRDCSISYRTLIVLVLDGDEYDYVYSATDVGTTSTSFVNDTQAAVTRTPSGACKALAIYNAGNDTSTLDSSGLSCAINVGGTDYCRLNKSPNNTDKHADCTCFYTWSQAASSVTVQGRLMATAGTATVSRRSMAVLYFADTTDIDWDTSSTDYSMTSGSPTDDPEISVTRTTSAERVLLVLAAGSNRHNGTSGAEGLRYGIYRGSDVAWVERSAYDPNHAFSMTPVWIETLAAGTYTAKGRFNSFNGSVGLITDHHMAALWIPTSAPATQSHSVTKDDKYAVKTTKSIGGAYAKSKPITLTHTGAIATYQKQLTILNGAGTDAGNMVYLGDGNCQNWPYDMRFTDANGANLPFFREYSNPSYAVVWVKYSQADGGTTINVNYGKAGDTDASSISDTFPMLGDHFDGTLGTLWDTDSGSPSVANSELTLTEPGTTTEQRVLSKTTVDADVRVRFRAKHAHSGDSNYHEMGGLWVDASNHVSVGMANGAGDGSTAIVYAKGTSNGYSYAIDLDPNHSGAEIDVYHIYEIVRSSTNRVAGIYDVDGTERSSTGSWFPTGPYKVMFEAGTGAAYTNTSIVVDWVFAATYATTEPTVTTGAIVSNGKPVQYAVKNSKGLTGLTPTFARNTVAYKADGSQVASGAARYENGGILIEDGTTNLLSANQAGLTTDTTGFTNQNSTLSRDTGASYRRYGSGALKAVTANSGTGEGFYINNVACNAATKYAVGIDLCGTGTVGISIQDCNSSGVPQNTYSGGTLTLSSTPQRLTQVITTYASAAYVRVRILTTSQQAATIYASGLQLEQKAVATSWVDGGVGRNYETLTVPTSAIMSPTQGTIELVVNVTQSMLSAGRNAYLFSTINGNNWFSLRRNNSDSRWYFVMRDNDGGTDAATLTHDLTVGPHRIACKWDASACSMFVDGTVCEVVDTTITLPLSVGPVIYLGGYHTSNYESNSYISDVIFSKVARSDANLAARGMTTALPWDGDEVYRLPLTSGLTPLPMTKSSRYTSKYTQNNLLLADQQGWATGSGTTATSELQTTGKYAGWYKLTVTNRGAGGICWKFDDVTLPATVTWLFAIDCVVESSDAPNLQWVLNGHAGPTVLDQTSGNTVYKYFTHADSSSGFTIYLQDTGYTSGACNVVMYYKNPVVQRLASGSVHPGIRPVEYRIKTSPCANISTSNEQGVIASGGTGTSVLQTTGPYAGWYKVDFSTPSGRTAWCWPSGYSDITMIRAGQVVTFSIEMIDAGCSNVMQPEVGGDGGLGYMERVGTTNLYTLTWTAPGDQRESIYVSQHNWESIVNSGTVYVRRPRITLSASPTIKDTRYGVKTTPSVIAKSTQYEIASGGTSTYSQTKDSKYAIAKTAAAKTKDTKYAIGLGAQPAKTKDTKYTVKRTPTAKTKTSQYLMRKAATAKTKNTQYLVSHAATAKTKDSKYVVKATHAALTKNVSYNIAGINVILKTKDSKYTVKTAPSAKTKTSEYRVLVVPAAKTKTAKYVVLSRPSLNKNVQYCVKVVPSSKTKTAKYSVKTATTKTVDVTYRIKFGGLAKNLTYTMKATPAAKTKTAEYRVAVTPAAKTKTSKYVMRAPVLVSKTTKYCIPGIPHTIEKSMRYVVIIKEWNEPVEFESVCDVVIDFPSMIDNVVEFESDLI